MEPPPPPQPLPSDAPSATREAIERTCAELHLRPPWVAEPLAPPKR